MERGRNSGITDEELAEAEAATRALLARWGEPHLVSPPSDLSARVVRRFTAAPSFNWRWLWLTVPLFAFVVGIWGIWFDSNGPAALVGSAETAPGRYLLALTLIAKPLWYAWIDHLMWWLAGLAVVIVSGRLWWRMVVDVKLAEVE